MVDPLISFTFHLVSDRCNKGNRKCCPVYGIVHIKDHYIDHRKCCYVCGMVHIKDISELTLAR